MAKYEDPSNQTAPASAAKPAAMSPWMVEYYEDPSNKTAPAASAEPAAEPPWWATEAGLTGDAAGVAYPDTVPSWMVEYYEDPSNQIGWKPKTARPARPATQPSWLAQQLGATNTTDYPSSPAYLIDNPVTRGLGQFALTTGTGLGWLAQKGVRGLAKGSKELAKAGTVQGYKMPPIAPAPGYERTVLPAPGYDMPPTTPGLDAIDRFLGRHIAADLRLRDKFFTIPKDASTPEMLIQGAANLGGNLALAGATGGGTAAATGSAGAARIGLTALAKRAVLKKASKAVLNKASKEALNKASKEALKEALKEASKEVSKKALSKEAWKEALKKAAVSPSLRVAGTLGTTQSADEAALNESAGHPVSPGRFGAMALTNTAANLVPLTGRWKIPTRMASGALVGAATNEATNLAADRPMGTGGLMAAGLGAGLGLLPGHYHPKHTDDPLAASIARRDLGERISALEQSHDGQVVPPDIVDSLATKVGQAHGMNDDAWRQAPASPAEAGAAQADAMLGDTAGEPSPSGTRPVRYALVDDEPVVASLPEVPPGVDRAALMERWLDARTENEKAAAAATIRAFDIQANESVRRSEADVYEDEPASRRSEADVYEDEPASRRSEADVYEDEPASRRSEADVYEDEPASRPMEEDEPASRPMEEDEPASRPMEEDEPASRPSASARVRAKAHMARSAVMGELAAKGYGQGVFEWNKKTSHYNGWRGGHQKFIIKVQDKMAPVRYAQEGITKDSGRIIADDANVHRMENLMHGRAADRLDRLDKERIFPLQNAMKKAGISSDLLMDYLYARHAPERNASVARINKDLPDGGSGMLSAKADDIMNGRADGEYSGKRITPENLPRLKALAERVDGLRDQTLKAMEDSGQITASLAASLRKHFTYYVPLRGKADHASEADPVGAGRGIDIKGKSVRRALGRGENNLAPPNILGNMIGDAQRAIINAEKARVGRALLKLASENPNPDLWQVEPVDMEWRLSTSTGEVYLAHKHPGADKDVLTVVDKGQAYHVKLVDPNIRDAVLNLGTDQAMAMVKGFGMINRWLAKVSTRYSPIFLMNNMLRDLTLGLVGLSVEQGHEITLAAIKQYLPAMHASWRDASHKTGRADVDDASKTMHDWAREYAENGGKTGIADYSDVDSIQEQVRKNSMSGMALLKEGKWSNMRALAAKGLDKFKPVLHLVELGNESVENALRLSSYVALRKKGMSQNEATAYAKDLTVNFNRKGQYAGVMNSLYLFYNAGVQGTWRGAKLLRNKKFLGFLGGISSVQSIQTMMLMSRKDDDGVSDWDKIPEWKKRRSMIFALPGTGNYLSWPMPYEMSSATYAGGRLTQWTMGEDPSQDKNIVNDLGVSLLSSFSPIPIDEGPYGLLPEIVKIPMHVAANRDDFGRRITNENPFSTYDAPRITMGRAGTPEPYVTAAHALNRLGSGTDYKPPEIFRGILDRSPDDIQYLTDTFIGGLGSFVSGSWSSATKSLAGVYTLDRHGNTKVDWRTLASQLPITRTFGWRVDSHRGTAGRYYDIVEKIERTKAMVQDAFDRRDPEGAKAILRDAGVFADGMTIRKHRDGSFATHIKHVKGGDIRTVSIADIPGSLYAGYKEAQGGWKSREKTGHPMTTHEGVQSFNRAIRDAYLLPPLKRARRIKELQNERAKVQGDFLKLYERTKSVIGQSTP